MRLRAGERRLVREWASELREPVAVPELRAHIVALRIEAHVLASTRSSVAGMSCGDDTFTTRFGVGAS